MKNYKNIFFIILIFASLGCAEKDSPVSVQPEYKEYVAILFQTGTEPPIINLIKNTTGADIISRRDDVGMYSLVANSPIFTTYKTPVVISGSVLGSASAQQTSLSVISINTKNASLEYSDGVLLSTTIMIRIYP